MSIVPFFIHNGGFLYFASFAVTANLEIGEPFFTANLEIGEPADWCVKLQLDTANLKFASHAQYL